MCVCGVYTVLCYIFVMKALSEYALCIPVVCDPVWLGKKDYFSNMLCGYF